MKNKTILSALCVLLFVSFISGCTDLSRAKGFGGTAKVDLAPNKKLVNVTWKDGDNLWVLTRDMRPGELPETYTFTEKSSLGVVEGAVLLVEHK
jgi:hypothetical protein